MKTLHLAVTAALTLTLLTTSGCAGIVKEMQRQHARQQEAALARSPMCESEAECHTMMGAAQVWVASRSNFRFEIANDNLIRTYSDGSDYWYTVTRTPTGGGRSRIVLTTGLRGSANLYSEFASFVQN